MATNEEAGKMSDKNLPAKTGGIGFVEAVKQFEKLGEIMRKNGVAAPESESKKKWIDIEKIAVVLIAIFVAVISVNHFRLVNARIESARPCADRSR